MDEKDKEKEIVIESEEIKDIVKNLKEKLKKCEEEKKDYLAGWQRAKADFINARKEEEERRREFIKFSEKNLIFELLNLADSFDNMFKTINENNISPSDKNWLDGIKNIYQQMMGILKSRGVEPIECLNKDFDPKEHESVGEIKIDTEEKENKIIEEIKRGYKMHGKVIRASQVKVGKL